MIMLENIWKSNLIWMMRPLNKTVEINSMVIVVFAVFYENNKYYLQVFLNECLYKSWII